MPTSTFENLPEDKRARIVKAAIAEFASRPYREASLDRVAQKARIAKGSLYQYFEDKADLYRHLVLGELGRRKLAAFEGARFEPGAPLAVRLRTMCRLGLELFQRDPLAASLASRLYEHETDDAVRRIHRDVREAGVAYLRGELEGASLRGELRPDVDLDAAARLLAHVTGAALVDLLMSRLGGSLERLATRRDAVDAETIGRTVDAVIDFVSSGLFRPDIAPERVS